MDPRLRALMSGIKKHESKIALDAQGGLGNRDFNDSKTQIKVVPDKGAAEARDDGLFREIECQGNYPGQKCAYAVTTVY